MGRVGRQRVPRSGSHLCDLASPRITSPPSLPRTWREEDLEDMYPFYSVTSMKGNPPSHRSCYSYSNIVGLDALHLWHIYVVHADCSA